MYSAILVQIPLSCKCHLKYKVTFSSNCTFSAISINVGAFICRYCIYGEVLIVDTVSMVYFSFVDTVSMNIPFLFLFSVIIVSHNGCWNKKIDSEKVVSGAPDLGVDIRHFFQSPSAIFEPLCGHFRFLRF